MTLNEILDEVRFAAGDICICVEDDVTSLDDIVSYCQAVGYLNPFIH